MIDDFYDLAAGNAVTALADAFGRCIDLAEDDARSRAMAVIRMGCLHADLSDCVTRDGRQPAAGTPSPPTPCFAATPSFPVISTHLGAPWQHAGLHAEATREC